MAWTLTTGSSPFSAPVAYGGFYVNAVTVQSAAGGTSVAPLVPLGFEDWFTAYEAFEPAAAPEPPAPGQRGIRLRD